MGPFSVPLQKFDTSMHLIGNVYSRIANVYQGTFNIWGSTFGLITFPFLPFSGNLGHYSLCYYIIASNPTERRAKLAGDLLQRSLC